MNDITIGIAGAAGDGMDKTTDRQRLDKLIADLTRRGASVV